MLLIALSLLSLSPLAAWILLLFEERELDKSRSWREGMARIRGLPPDERERHMEYVRRRFSRGPGPVTVGVGWSRSAGLLSVWGETWALHLLVRRGHWIWGREVEEYDQILTYLGCGPLFLWVEDT